MPSFYKILRDFLEGSGKGAIQMMVGVASRPFLRDLLPMQVNSKSTPSDSHVCLVIV